LCDFGDVWLAWGLWRLLGLETLLASVLDFIAASMPAAPKSLKLH
jgi:hypothetical protein